MIALQPMDIVVVDSKVSSWLHNVIQWRCLDDAVHCAIVLNSQGDIIEADFNGIKESTLDSYAGRNITIHRYKFTPKLDKLHGWLYNTVASNTGYDYRQWLFGFVLGIGIKKLSDDPTKWTCAELPYWMFQESGYPLTVKEEILPMPRLFRYNNNFTKVFEGVI